MIDPKLGHTGRIEKKDVPSSHFCVGCRGVYMFFEAWGRAMAPRLMISRNQS
jgi:hypothetical protein